MTRFSHAVRTETDSHRTQYAPNNKFKAFYIGNGRHMSEYNQNHGMMVVRYCDNGYNGDNAPSLTFSERVFFPQWPVA